jgi:hypothetical protein
MIYSITGEEYNLLIINYKGIIAHRKEQEGNIINYYIKLFIPGYKKGIETFLKRKL